MGMIAKSIVTGLVLAGLAGGGVYYGLSPEAGKSTTVDRLKSIAPKVKVVEARKKTAHPHSNSKKKETDVKEALNADTRKTDKPERSEKKWIDQYLDEDSKPGFDATLSADKNKRTTKTRKTVTITETTNDQDDAPKVKKSETRLSGVVTDADLKNAKIKDKKMAKSMGKLRTETKTMDSFKTLEIIMDESDNVKDLDLKDRAYLNAVDYALMHGYFGEAKTALGNINQPELRETARSRIALRYASTGNPEAAFEMIDNVELMDFKDPMRLQIIEAMINADAVEHSHK